MTRTTKPFSLAALLAATLLGLGHSASAAPLTLADVSDPQGGLFPDPALPAEQRPDIARVLVTLDGSEIRFRTEFYPLGLDPALVRVDYRFDMDQDASTGSAFGGWEYWTSNLTPAADTVTLLRHVDAAPSEALVTVALERGADWAEFAFDLALLGGDAQFDFVAGTFVKVSDTVFTGLIDSVAGSMAAPLAVPEPGALALGLAAGFAWLGGRGARRRNAPSAC